MKQNIISSLFLASFTSLLLTACGGGGGSSLTNDTGTTDEENNSTSLNNGSWLTNPACTKTSNGSAKFTTIVSDTSFVISMETYESANCSDTTSTPIILDYSLSYGTKKGYNSSVCSNINEIDLTLKTATVGGDILSDAQITKAGFSKKIYSLMCATTDRLYLGSGAKTPQKRPTNINETLYYLRLVNGMWIKGEFNNASAYKNKCDAPRVNMLNPRTGSPYIDTKGSLLDEKNWLRSLTNEDYLWYKEVTDRDPSLFGTPKDYFKVLKTTATSPSGKLKDKFHFTYNTADYYNQSQSGVTYGYGAELLNIRKTPPRDVRISYTQPSSPANNANVIRGSKILEVDGYDFINGTGIGDIINAALSPKTLGESHTFKLLNPITNTTRTVTMLSAEVTTQPVQKVKTFTTAAGKVGYMLFNEHIATAEQQLINAVTTLKNENIDDLIIDLRYNSGGALYIAAELASMIAGPDATNNRIVGKLNFNDKHPSVPIPFFTKTPSFSENPNIDLPNLNLTRIFVLTGPNTCSASEALINSLRGVDLEVIQIGATTCGKPYGFSPEENCSTTYFSINFEIVNTKGFGEYSDGFTPWNEVGGIGEKLSGCYVADDLLHPLGDASEKRLKMALHYQAFGQCSTTLPKAARRGEKTLPIEGEMMKPSWLKNMTLQ